MDVIGYYGTTSDKAGQIKLNWEWTECSRDGYLGHGLYFYTNEDYTQPDDSHIKQLSDFNNRYLFRVIKAKILNDKKTYVILDLDSTQKAKSIELLIQAMKSKFPNISNKEIEKKAIDLYRQKFKPASIKKTIKLSAVLDWYYPPDVPIVHICVYNKDCIVKASIG